MGEGDSGWNNMYWNYEDYAFGYGRDKNYWNSGGSIGTWSGSGYYSSNNNNKYNPMPAYQPPQNNHKYNPMPAYQPPKCDPSEWCYDYNCCHPQQNCYEICEWVSGGRGGFGGKGGKGGKGGYFSRGGYEVCNTVCDPVHQ